MRAFAGILGIAAALALLGCFETRDGGPDLQGPGSETVGLSGEARYPDGRPAAGALVIARPAAYVKDTAERAPRNIPGGETRADGKGAFAIKPLPADSYYVEIRGDSGLAALVAVAVAPGKPATAPKATLKPVGRLTGAVSRLRPSQASVFIRIQGMDRLQYVAPDSVRFAFPDLPEGSYVVRAMSPDSVLGEAVLEDVEIRSGETRDVGALVLDAFSREAYADWAHSLSLVVRTGAAGADLAAAVTDFPLLVRLDAANFPFDSTVSPRGSDLRFASASGRRLPFEIESWDSAAKQALVWVRVDTLKPGDDAQAIRMYWGKKNAPALSSGPSVFGSADGYRGAWHMRRDPVQDNFPDASGQGNTAVTVAAAAAAEALSPWFTCVQLDGKLGMLATQDSLPAPQIFSLSMWIRADGPGKLIGFENVQGMSKGYDSSSIGPYDRHIWIEPDGSLHFGVYIADPPANAMSNERILVAPAGLIDGKWHHVAATQDPAVGMALYVDGKRVAGNADVSHAEVMGGYWILGGGTLREWAPALAANTHFQGDLDEARVADVLHSADWIKLAFETQKEGSSVVLFVSP